jgi:Domain of unknown function (DUF1929)
VRPRIRQRLFKSVTTLFAVGGLVAVNGPTLISEGREALHEHKINSHGYKARAGHWSVLPVPENLRVNAIHSALLKSGKVLIIAGSGNKKQRFEAGRFESLLWDPATDKLKRIHTPDDMFCAGHAFLPDGKLLIAGGTKRYEVLEKEVERAAGAVTIKNESPDGRPQRLEKGARLVAPGGTAFRTTRSVLIRPAAKRIASNGVTTVTASATEVWVEAVARGRGSEIEGPTELEIPEVGRKRRENVYGIAPAALTMAKQEYWGEDKSYVFDPDTERYVRVDNLTLARWYPTLVGLEDGRVLSVSGLDGFGRIVDGHNEIYDPRTKRWEATPQLRRRFPTYPSLFLMPSGKLFYTGSNAGYGSDTVGRDPGIWDLTDNSFQKVPGLRDPRQTETSGSVLLPPAQDQRYMIAGGGGIGESDQSTARTDVIDLDKPDPRYEPGPDLEEPTRYPNMVITPDDRVVVTGGSRGYRGEGASDVLVCQLYDPKKGSMSRMADPTVGRNYHSGALLLPDGRVITLGGDPLYRDAENKLPGRFEKRIEIYSPPYLYQGERPRITSGPEEVRRGATVRFGSPDAAAIRTARLIRPSAVTHVTDVEQRSVALSLTRERNGIRVTIPSSTGLLPSGWYMLFVTGENGTPSEARWVRVEESA